MSSTLGVIFGAPPEVWMNTGRLRRSPDRGCYSAAMRKRRVPSVLKRHVARAPWLLLRWVNRVVVGSGSASSLSRFEEPCDLVDLVAD